MKQSIFKGIVGYIVCLLCFVAILGAVETKPTVATQSKMKTLDDAGDCTCTCTDTASASE